MSVPRKAKCAARRGKPVVALLGIIGGWVLLRLMLWQSPLALHELTPQELTPPPPATSAGTVAARLTGAAPASASNAGMAGDAPQTDLTRPEPPLAELPVAELPLAEFPSPELHGREPALPAIPQPEFAPPPAWQEISDTPSNGAPPVSARRIVGHNMLLMAGLSQMDVAPSLLPYLHGASPVAAAVPTPPAPAFVPAAAALFEQETAPIIARSDPSRWAMDAWALWREDDTSRVLATRPSYGRSQIGAVLRYRLAPSSPFAPQAYLRASAALAGAREEEGAVGLSARLLPNVPVRFAAEGRLRQTATGIDARAAVYGVSEFPPLALPLETTAEAYVQGGYVTGRDATAFVDGQARVTREMAEVDNFRLSAGGGAWGGAQDGAGRFDIGPSAMLTFGAGGVNARVSADYRFRVAGDARPTSGPTITISAGF